MQNAAVIGGLFGGRVAGQYSMHVQLTPSDAVVVGGQLDVSCDIWNWQPERSMFVVWLRRAHGSEVELGTNERIVEQFRERYSARKELRRPADFTRVSYYLTITGTNALPGLQVYNGSFIRIAITLVNGFILLIITITCNMFNN